MSQKYTNLGSLFTDIADAIREKKGTNESIVADDFPDEINSIESGSNITDFEQKFIKRAIQLSIYENSNVTVIGNGAFYYYSSLRSISFPQVTTIGSSAFYSCYSLASVTLGGQQSQGGIIYPYAFSKCYRLTDLHLQGSYLYSLSNSGTFSSTPIAGYSASAGTYGSIYVPASLYSQYISATNWTYFSSRFVSVSQNSGGNNNQGSGGNNDCGFTVSGNTLTITDYTLLNDGIVNDNDYLMVGCLFNDEQELMDSLNAIIGSITNDNSVDFRYLNQIFVNNEITGYNYEGSLAVCVTDGYNKYYISLDEEAVDYIYWGVFMEPGYGIEYYIPVIFKQFFNYQHDPYEIINENLYGLGYSVYDDLFMLEHVGNIDENSQECRFFLDDIYIENYEDRIIYDTMSIEDSNFKYPGEE